MAIKFDPEGKRSPRAQRMLLLRTIMAPTAKVFAKRLGIDSTQWSQIENGGPISKEVAFKIRRGCPGVTLDWIYFGDMSGLPVALARQLGELPKEDEATSA